MTAALQQKGFDICKTAVHARVNKLTRDSCIAADLRKKSQKKLTPRDERQIDRFLRFEGMRSKMQIFKKLRRLGHNVCYQTVRRSLDRIPTVKFSRPTKKVYMTAAHKKARLAWANSQLLSPTDWTKVFFMDEKQWRLDGPVSSGKVLYDIRDGRPALTRKGQRNTSVEVWGTFSLTAVPPLAVISDHFDSKEYIAILAARFLSYARLPIPVLLHDRHPAHHSKLTAHWLQVLGIKAITLPAKSPDLNPIENIWSVVSRNVYSGMKTYDSKDALLEAVKAAWDSIRSNHTMRQHLVDSMTRRLQEVVRMKGGQTKF